MKFKFFFKVALAGLLTMLPVAAVPIAIVPDPGVAGTSGTPFGGLILPVSMQQFTLSTAFSALGGPANLLSLDFSSPTIMAPGTMVTATGNTIAAGFTTVALASLTTNQATNLSNPLTTVASSYSIVSQAGVFNWHIDFTTPIMYDPSQGNLVLQFVSTTSAGVSIFANGPSPNTVTVFDRTTALGNPPGIFSQSRLFQFNFDTIVAPELSPSSALSPLCLLTATMLMLLSKRAGRST